MAKDEKKLPEEKLEELEIDLDKVGKVTSGAGPVTNPTGDVDDDMKNRA